MGNRCLTKEIVYKATICSVEEQSDKRIYFGITKNEFKIRYGNHKTSFSNRYRAGDTALSKYYWKIIDMGKTPKIKWEIVKRAKSCTAMNNTCTLCITEKILITTYKFKRKDIHIGILNSRSESGVKCIHRKQFSLEKYK